MKKTIICIVGRNSSGKSTIARKIADKFGLKIVQSYATRQPRKAEIKNGLENSDHIFITESQFNEIEKDEANIAAKTTINGVRYCTTVDILKQSDIYVIDPNGIDYLSQKFSDEFNIVQFYVYANSDVRKKRFVSRGDATAFKARDDAESSQFDDYEKNHKYDIVIYNNDNIDDAVEVMASYVNLIIQKPEEPDEEKNVSDVEADAESKDSEQAHSDSGVDDVNEPIENTTESEIDSESSNEASKKSDAADDSSDCDIEDAFSKFSFLEDESDENDDMNDETSPVTQDSEPVDIGSPSQLPGGEDELSNRTSPAHLDLETDEKSSLDSPQCEDNKFDLSDSEEESPSNISLTTSNEDDEDDEDDGDFIVID